MIEWAHTAVELIGTVGATTVPIALYIWANQRQAKADAEKRQAALNEVIGSLVTERKYFPAHGHSEKAGPLQAEGINYPPDDRRET